MQVGECSEEYRVHGTLDFDAGSVRPFSDAAAEGSVPSAGCPEVIGTPFSCSRGEGEEAEFIYKVVSGAVRTHAVLIDGRRQITGFHRLGDLFGSGPGETHRQTAETLTEARVLIFRRWRIERAATGGAAFACRLWDLAKDDLRHARDHRDHRGPLGLRLRPHGFVASLAPISRSGRAC